VDKIGIVDTMFARFDMGTIVEEELKRQSGYGERFSLIRRTVPGIKDLAVECKLSIEGQKCAIVIALGMPGNAELDRFSAHEASLGIMAVQLQTGIHILQVFVHQSEESDPDKLREVCIDRASKHAVNAYWLLYHPEELRKRAGQGIRQGYADVGSISKN
jgi:riboflavin synthase